MGVLVDVTYYVGIVDGLGQPLVTFQKICCAKERIKTPYLDDLMYGCFPIGVKSDHAAYGSGYGCSSPGHSVFEVHMYTLVNVWCSCHTVVVDHISLSWHGIVDRHGMPVVNCGGWAKTREVLPCLVQ